MSTDRFSAQTLRHTGTVLGVLSLLTLIIFGAWFWQANASQDRVNRAQMTRLSTVELGGKNLSTALDKQRAQFLACANAAAGTPGCSAPVAPPAAQVAPQIITGPVGPQGYQGPQGPQGPKGDIGLTGVNGLAGVTGTNGTGTNGTNGTAGKDGAPGTPGAKGEPGPAGASGAPGATGQPGQSAYPFTFSFDTTGGRTYTCTLPAAGERGTCTETTSTPTATATP